jgi:hypothetical protein
MDPQELEQLRQKLNELNQSFDSLGTNLNKTSLGVEDVLGKKLPTGAKAAGEALKGLGKSIASYNDAMIRGERGAKVAANSMGELADGIQTALNVLAMFAPGGLIVKGLLVGTGMLVKGISEYGKAASQQADALFRAYKDLSKISAAGAGLDDTFRNLQRIGLTTNQLDQFTAVLKKAGPDLLYFGSSMADGAREFSEVVGDLYKGPLGRDLEMLGLEFEDLASSAATYVTLQGRLGRLQMKTQEDLMRETYAYTRELDLLARLTGQSREEQEKTQRSLLEDERWTGFLEEAKASGQDLGELQNYLATLPADLRKGLQHIIAGGGAISSEEARKTIQTLPEAYQIAQDIISQNTSASQAYEKTFAAIDRFSKQTAGSRRVGATEGFGLSLGGQGGLYERTQMLENIKARVAEGQSLEDAMRAEQDRARLADDAKQSLIDTDRSQRNYQQNLDAFTNKGLRAATSAANTFAQALERGSRALPGSPIGGRATTGGAVAPSAPVTGAARGLGTSGNYIEKVIQAESGGRNIANQSGVGGSPTSTAFGLAQITKGTFEDLAKKAGPGNPLYGKTFEDMKADVNLQRQALGQLTDKNRVFLQNAGLSTSDAALYLAHFLGPGGAKRALSQPDSAPIQGAVDFQQFMANPNLQRMATVGDLKAWADQKMGGGGYRNGGVATGPASGYNTVLHGTEAIVPLPDGKTIPVTMNMEQILSRIETAFKQPGFTGVNSDTSAMMSRQISQLDELINQMRNQVNISTKLLQYAR